MAGITQKVVLGYMFLLQVVGPLANLKIKVFLRGGYSKPYSTSNNRKVKKSDAISQIGRFERICWGEFKGWNNFIKYIICPGFFLICSIATYGFSTKQFTDGIKGDFLPEARQDGSSKNSNKPKINILRQSENIWDIWGRIKNKSVGCC